MGHRSRSRERSPRGNSSRNRSRSTSRDRRSSKHSHRARRRSASRDRHRHRSRSPAHQDQKPREQPQAEATQDKQRQRQEKLAAWRKQQEVSAARPPVAETPQMVWTPWEEPAAPITSVPARPAASFVQPPPPKPLAPLEDRMYAAMAGQAGQHMVTMMQEETDEDPLDAFMAAEVMPEVKEKEEEEQQRRQEEKKQMAQQLAKGQIPKLSAILEDSEDEEEPDAVVHIPINKVKLVVGPGGDKIKFIQRKSKCRLQIKKEDEELNTAFGTSSIQAKIKALQNHKNPQGKTTAIMLFGSARECETAQAMIEEAIDNREQKQKQRQKEYDRKREAKWRNRQMYHMRHTRDYEALGLPIGASKADVRRAYKQLAVQWHPDKHPEDPEAAKAKFQEISRAYNSLMTTDEDEIIEQLAHK